MFEGCELFWFLFGCWDERCLDWFGGDGVDLDVMWVGFFCEGFYECDLCCFGYGVVDEFW